MTCKIIRGLAWFGLFSAVWTTSFACSYGQSPVQTISRPTHPQPVPLSGEPLPNSPVLVEQQGARVGSTTGSVDVISDQIQIQPPFNGGRPEGKVTDDTIGLTLDVALKMALKNDLARLTRDASVMQAEGQRLSARSALLPNLNIGAAEVFAKENLRTVGIKTDLVPEAAIYNYDDLRLVLRQSVFDLVSLHQFYGSTEQVKSTRALARNTRDLIILAVGGSYLRLTATGERLAASDARIKSSRAVFVRARDQHEAGLAPRIDANRAEVQMETEEERSITVQAELETQSLHLARMIGLPAGQMFTPIDVYGFHPDTGYTLQTALDRASSHRQDLVAARLAEKVADSAVKAAHSERLPSLVIHADAGVAGTAPTQNSIGVYTVQGVLTIPVYNGGRVAGDEKQADAARVQRQSEYADTQVKVDQDVREAFIQLKAANSQVSVAQHNRDLAHETLTQSIDRFIAGVTDTVEVVQAEQAVVQADDDMITALYQHNLAKLSLAAAMGLAEDTLTQLLRK